MQMQRVYTQPLLECKWINTWHATNKCYTGYFIAFARMIIKSARVTRGSSGLCCCVRVTSFERWLTPFVCWSTRWFDWGFEWLVVELLGQSVGCLLYTVAGVWCRALDRQHTEKYKLSWGNGCFPPGPLHCLITIHYYLWVYRTLPSDLWATRDTPKGKKN